MEHLDQTHTLKLYKLGARLRETLTIDSKFDQVELELVFFFVGSHKCCSITRFYCSAINLEGYDLNVYSISVPHKNKTIKTGKIVKFK